MGLPVVVSFSFVGDFLLGFCVRFDAFACRGGEICPGT